MMSTIEYQHVGKRYGQLTVLQDLSLSIEDGELSGGQRQRVAMGRAIVRAPQVFLMDEPLSNLDAKLRNQMRVEIKQLQRSLKTTMVYVTHDQVEAMTQADRIVILEAGKIRQTGTPEEVYHQPADTFVADFIGSPAMNFLRAGRKESRGLKLAPGISFFLPPFAMDALEGEEFVVGVRPEHFLFEPETAALPREAIVWISQVRLLESLGGECLVHLDPDGQHILLKMPGSPPCRRGDQVRIGFLPESAHLFSGGSGTCLRHGL
jgi:multiple sugar transport system ATP-binding protein